MSELISSLLIEPVVRQARRLSHQTAESQPPSDHDQPVPPSSTQARPSHTTSRSRNDNGCSAMSDLEHGTHSEVKLCSDGFAGAQAGPSMSPSPSPLDVNDGHAETDYTLSPRSTRDTSSSTPPHTLDVHPDISPRNNSTGSSQHIASTSTPNAAQHAHRRTDSGLREADIYETGGHFLLPEDDGMGILREKIHAIRDLNLSSVEKARMVHELMIENYNASREDDSNQPLPAAPSPSSPQTPERVGTPMSRWSEQSFGQLSVTPTSTAWILPQEIRYNLKDEDLKPTFHPKTEPDSPIGEGEDADAEEFEEACLGCPHYKRNVKLQCSSCKKWYTCRFCHDEVEDHHLNRPKTENMLCMLCGHAQPAAQICAKCDGQAAQYYCNTCKLWDNDSSKSIYHCNDCGICRIGQGLGKDFFHCKTCCVCLPISIENTHRCIERSTQCDCPICGDYMFTSPETVVFMRCGHSIHQKCLSEYSKASYRCPICNKTITNMESTFRNLDRTIQGQPMPVEFKDTKALIYCNDCGVKSVVKYHWLGLRCDMCESYNTAQLRLFHGEAPGSIEQDGETGSIATSRVRALSHGADEAMSFTQDPLRVETSTIPETSPNSRLNAPSSAEPNGRFSSYSLTRGRAVSPVISNYFGIPPDRGSEQSKSTSIFGGGTSKDSGNGDSNELRFWGTKLKYGYGFLGGETESVEGGANRIVPGSNHSDEEEEDDEEEEEDEEEDEEEEDEDEEAEGIDIFGHR